MAGSQAAAAAAAGADMARVRIRLNGHAEPNESFIAETRAALRTLHAAGLRVLAVLDGDLTVAPDGMGAFADEPPEARALAWAEEMTANAARLAGALGEEVAAWEILPLPNRGNGARIAPGRWAALLTEVAAAVRGEAPGATIVSGCLLSTDTDDGVDYLTAAYQAAVGGGLWRPSDGAPFDALGVALGVMADGGPSEPAVAAVLAERPRRLWRVMERFEGTEGATRRGVYVTGLAWDAERIGADLQARNVWTALNTLTSDPIVRMVIWTGLTDANPHAEGATGLYRGEGTAPADRRWAWTAFNDFALYARQISPAASAASLLAVQAAGEVAAVTVQAPVVEDEASATQTVAAEGAAPMIQEMSVGGIAPGAGTMPPGINVPALDAALAEDGASPELEAEPAEATPAPDIALEVDVAPTVPETVADGSPGLPETVVFRIPDASDVLRAQGLDGVRLAAALEAVKLKYGGHEWLPPGEYRVVIRPAEAPEAVAPRYTNQQVISALYRAGGGTWDLFERTGLRLSELAAQRASSYTGPAVAAMAALSEDEQAAVARELAALTGESAG